MDDAVRKAVAWGDRMKRQRDELVELCEEVLSLFDHYQIKVSTFPGPSTSQKLEAAITRIKDEDNIRPDVS